MVNDPRRHHYLPQCYLRGFAETRDEGATLHAYDITETRWFATTSLKVGVRRDFNRVDNPDFAAATSSGSYLDSRARSRPY
jgi:Protein of unknown function (DUF4238)